MMLKKRIKFNVDKFRMSLIQPDGLFERLSDYGRHEYVDCGDFYLRIIDDGRARTSDKPSTKIVADVILADDTKLGTFKFNDSAKYEGLCFFEFENKALYQCESFAYFDYVQGVLGLRPNSVTEIEVAADINFQVIPRIRKLIKNHGDFDMVYNGKRVEEENRKIAGCGEFYGRSRARLEKTPTLYFEQAMSDGLRLKVYDKTREIEEESPEKTYIEQANGFGRRTFRIEVTVRWEQFKEWQSYVNSNGAQVDDSWKQVSENDTEYLARSLFLLSSSEEYRCQLWRYFTHRLIYWRNRHTGQAISLLDVVSGEA